MSLASIIRSGIAIADKTVISLQDTITIAPWIGIGIYGEPKYGAPISMKAIIEEKEVLRRLSNGQEIIQKAQVTIPRSIANTTAEGRRNPIDPRDKIVFSSGFTGPILNVEGIIDPSTHNPYMLVVILG